MALRYFDGFDDYSYAQALRYWTTKVDPNAGGSFSTGRNGGTGFHALAVNTSNSCLLYKTFDVQATWVLGVALKVATLPTVGTAAVFMGVDDGGTTQVDVRVNSDGTLSVTRNGTALGTTSFMISATVWYYIELLVTINNTTGSYTLYINGTSRSTGSSLNTRATANNWANRVFVGVATTNATTNNDTDDFYCADGTAGINTPIGDCRVETKLPTGDGATNNFTRSTGATNFSNVDVNPATDDTDYNSTANVGDIDLYTYPALATTAGSVKGVMTVPILRNDNAGAVSGVSVYRSASGNYFGTPNSVGSTTYAAFPDIQVVDPATGVTWTVAGVNAAQFGIKRTL